MQICDGRLAVLYLSIVKPRGDDQVGGTAKKEQKSDRGWLAELLLNHYLGVLVEAVAMDASCTPCRVTHTIT